MTRRRRSIRWRRPSALEGGAKLTYDRVVVAPGIAFKFGAIEGYDDAATQIMPHAWNAGPQTKLLRQQLESMEDGGVFVIVAPPDPFRCPPGPYERACLVAYYFKQYKPRAKILILDAKDSFFEQDLFQDAWNRHYPGMIEWLPGQFTGGVKSVDVKARSIKTAGETFKASVANVIPPQMAGELAQQAGLADQSGWCPIDPMTFESKLQPGIHVVGDAISGGRYAEIGLRHQQPGQGLRLRHRGGTDRIRADCASLVQYMLHFSCSQRRGDRRHQLQTRGGVDQDQRHLHQQGGRERRDCAAKAARAADGWYAAFTHDVFG